MEFGKEKKAYKKGMLKGALTSGLIILVISGIIIGVIFSRYWEREAENKARSLVLGREITDKINTLSEYIDYLFLYDYDKEEIANNIYKAIFEGLNDPYSRYYTEEEYAELYTEFEGTYYGIGVVVTQDEDTGEVRVVQPYKGSPGEEAGILPDDIIKAVEGTDITGMDLDLAVKLIKGDEGSYVTLTIVRGTETFDVEVERRNIEIQTVEYEMLDDNIGYISISQFEGKTAGQFADAMETLTEDGMEGLIIDIRNNPGGMLDVVTEMLDTLLPEGLIVYTMDKYGNKDEFKSDEDTILDVPCAVLVNGNSASASEIFSGALQDYQAARIIGTQTFGKGIVQSIIPLEDGSAFKITVEDYYTPNGRNIHGVGITPDEVVEFDSELYYEDGTDTQLEAAIKYLNGEMK